MLLDTHVLVWLALGDKTLGKKTRALLDTALHASESLSVSAISYWEIGMLTDKGRLNLDSVLTRRASIQMGISEVKLLCLLRSTEIRRIGSLLPAHSRWGCRWSPPIGQFSSGITFAASTRRDKSKVFGTRDD
jgi:PIN domain nuclease of toxin-antitoxin system